MLPIDQLTLKPKRILGIRHVQAVMLFLALVASFGMRINMSMAIVAMTDSSQENYFQWDTRIQSIVLSSFFWGYIVLQIPGGELAGRYGGKLLVTLSVAINSFVSLIIPIGASFGGWQLVCACRVIQGLSQGFLIPSIYSLMVNWAPLDEKSRLCTVIYSVIRVLFESVTVGVGGTGLVVQYARLLPYFGVQFGTALQLIISGFIADSWGWQAIFYTNGILGLSWTAIYIILGSNSPQCSKIISSKEKLYIQSSLGHVGGKKKLNTPWKDILTSLPFFSLIIVHCGENWGFWTLATEIPSYMKQVLGVNVKQNGMMSALPYLMMYLISFPLGFTSDYIIRKNWLSVTTSRKLFNSIAHFGPALALIGLSFVSTEDVVLAVALLTLAVGLNAGIYTGFLLVHIDMAPNFAGVLMGVTNCISNIVSLIAPLVAGVILNDQTNVNDWQKVFYVAAAVYVTGNLIFLIIGTSEKQNWNDVEQTTDTENSPQQHELKCTRLEPTTLPPR